MWQLARVAKPSHNNTLLLGIDICFCLYSAAFRAHPRAIASFFLNQPLPPQRLSEQYLELGSRRLLVEEVFSLASPSAELCLLVDAFVSVVIWITLLVF